MQVLITKSFVTNCRAFNYGTQLDLPDALAKHFISEGFAEPVEREAAAYKPQRNAAKTSPKIQRRG